LLKALTKPRFHIEELLRFLFHHFSCRDPRGKRDNLGDVLRADHFPALVTSEPELDARSALVDQIDGALRQFAAG
jgi:hypothetical protein